MGLIARREATELRSLPERFRPALALYMAVVGSARHTSSIVSGQHLKLLHELESLAASGKSWAHAALTAAESAGFIHFSAAGFTRLFEKKAAAAGNIRLVSLDRLFA